MKNGWFNWSDITLVTLEVCWSCPWAAVVTYQAHEATCLLVLLFALLV